MIELYQFPTMEGLLNPSVFCMKVELYLKLAKIPYQVKYVRDPRKAPKGKFPYIRDGEQLIPDSDFIIHYLKKNYGDTLDQHLNEEQKTKARLIQRLLDEHFYWILLYSRWLDDQQWPITLNLFFGKKRNFVINFIANKIRKKMARDLYGQGTGRHSLEEVYQKGCEDLALIESLLDDHDYILGDQISSADCVVYATLANVLIFPCDTPLKQFLKNSARLLNYCERMKARIEKE